MKLIPRFSIDWSGEAEPQPDPQLAAAKELNEAKFDLLKAEKELEYWRSMVPMLHERIERLESRAGGDKSQQF